jgi:hypothetical protein
MRRVSEVLSQAFAILERDQPAAFFRVAAELDRLTVHLVVDGESFTSAFAADRPCIVDPAPERDFPVRAATTRSTIVDLCDGRIRLLEAVMKRRLEVWASEERLLRISRAVTAFSEGAVRARRMRALLDSFRTELG